MKSLNIFFFLPYWPERTKSKPKIDCEIIIISTTLCDVYNVAILIFLQNFVSYTRTQFLNIRPFFFHSYFFFFCIRVFSRHLSTNPLLSYTVELGISRTFYIFSLFYTKGNMWLTPPPISKSKIIIEAFTVAYRWTREFLYFFNLLHKGQFVDFPPKPPISKTKFIKTTCTVAYCWTRDIRQFF